MNILGLNAFHGDSAACLLRDGKIVSAAEEERFRRIKHWAGFPSESIRFCLESNGLSLQDIDVIAINSDSSFAKSEKIKFVLSGKSSLALIREKLFVRKKRASIVDYLQESFAGQSFNGVVENIEHHSAHLASAYNVSGFKDAVAVSIDGFGDFSSGAWGVGSGSQIEVKHRIYFPHSMGVFYQALTQYLGFHHYGDEYKVMGLAPYGELKYLDKLAQIVKPTKQGGYQLDLGYFTHHKKPIGYTWDDGIPKSGILFSSKLEALLGTARQPDQPLEQKHKDIARSVQRTYENIFFNMLNTAYQSSPSKNLALAGGCGMNSVANGKIHLNTPFENIYVQSAAGDAGGAIGAAVEAAKRHGQTQFATMPHAYLGSQYSDQELEQVIQSYAEQWQSQQCKVETNIQLDTLVDRVSDSIIDGKVIGWFQGAMEWGPRALGNRSILGDPRREDMKDILNLKIKRRESFRPFAPSVLREAVSEWFESDGEVPFMMKVFQIKQDKRAMIPAVTHADGSGRLQTVKADTNLRYYSLIKAFSEKTGVPMLLNTSFNENEPVVCRPQEAIDCFLRTKMDVLVLGSHLIYR